MPNIKKENIKMPDGSIEKFYIYHTEQGKLKYIKIRCAVSTPETLCACCSKPILYWMKPYAYKCIMLNDDNSASDRISIFHGKHAPQTISRNLDSIYNQDRRRTMYKSIVKNSTISK
jgi:hypothetical protein